MLRSQGIDFRMSRIYPKAVIYSLTDQIMFNGSCGFWVFALCWRSFPYSNKSLAYSIKSYILLYSLSCHYASSKSLMASGWSPWVNGFQKVMRMYLSMRGLLNIPVWCRLTSSKVPIDLVARSLFSTCVLDAVKRMFLQTMLKKFFFQQNIVVGSLK